MNGLLPVEEALSRILGSVDTTPPVISRALIDSLGCVLAEDLFSPISVPANDNSAMDGYAIRSAEVGQVLPVSQRIPAGSVGTFLEEGTAARIFTGAEIPPGADAVVMQENCLEDTDGVSIQCQVTPGENVRPRGQDIREGELVLSAGKMLSPQDLGLLASIGASEVNVYKPIRVAIMSTGDELVEPGADALEPGQLYNSNRYTLAALLRNMNFEVVDGGIIPDDAQATGLALQRAAQSADCVISSGGVSVGEEDHVKGQVERLGRLDLWKLALKPGKPLAFGRVGDTPFIGLPGNPTSVFVTFCIIARPYLKKLQGMREMDAPSLRASAGFKRQVPGTRQEYLRVQLSTTDQGLLASPYENQSSGVLSSVSHSNALAVIPIGTVVDVGDQVEVIPLVQLIH
ncbi:MAG: gephyrin-like molybdotransferase Glp [Halioglobus sp.]